MRIPNLKVLDKNNNLNFCIKEKRLVGQIKSIDLYISSNIEFNGVIRLNLTKNKWRKNLRLKKSFNSEEEDDFITLVNEILEIKDIKELVETLCEYGFSKNLKPYDFISEFVIDDDESDEIENEEAD